MENEIEVYHNCSPPGLLFSLLMSDPTSALDLSLSPLCPAAETELGVWVCACFFLRRPDGFIVYHLM